MGWGRYLLMGNLGQQLDIQDREREIDQLRDHLDSQWSRDQDQDAQIATIQREISDLKLYIASLVKLLVNKQTVTQEEVARIVSDIERGSGER